MHKNESNVHKPVLVKLKMNVVYSKIIFMQLCLGIVRSCQKSDGYCCFNFYKNEDGFCEECPPGTFGTNCTSYCPQGFFGKNCLSPCICSVEECDAKNGCVWPNNVTSHPLFAPPLTTIFPVRDSQTPLTPQSTDSNWKSTTFLLIGVLAVFLLFSGRKNCSCVLKRRSRNAEMPPVLFRAQSTRDSRFERVVNLPDESNIASLPGKVPDTQKRWSTPNVYCQQNEEDAYSAGKVESKINMAEQHYEDDWGDDDMLLTKPIGKLSSKSDDKPRKPNFGFRLSYEDKSRPYSSIKYNRSSQKNTCNRGQTPQRECSAEQINEYDDVAPCFKDGSVPNTMTNETSYLEVEVSSGNAQQEKEELPKLTEVEESECSLYQDIVCRPQESDMQSCLSYANHEDVSEYETKRFSSDHTVSEDESVHMNSLYTSLIVDNSSKNDLSSNDNESINPSEL